MKRILCLLLIILMIVSQSAFSLRASSSGNGEYSSLTTSRSVRLNEADSSSPYTLSTDTNRYIIYYHKTFVRKTLAIIGGYYIFDPVNQIIYAIETGKKTDFDIEMHTYDGSFDSTVSVTWNNDVHTVWKTENGRLINNGRNDDEIQSELTLVEDEATRKSVLSTLQERLIYLEEYDSYVSQFSGKYKIVEFGSYEQDGNTENGPEPLKWLVIKTSKGKSLLLSLYVLDFMKPNYKLNGQDYYLYYSWGDSAVRKWLNDDFYKTAFTKKEKSNIQTTTLKLEYPYDPECPLAKTKETTKDKVFLFSVGQANKYLPGKLGRAQMIKGTYSFYGKTVDGYAYWLTLTKKDAYIWYSIDGDNRYGKRDETGIRPAIWVSSKALK